MRMSECSDLRCVRSNSAFAASGAISPNGSEWLQV